MEQSLNPEPLTMSEQEAAAKIGISIPALRELIRGPNGPPCIEIGNIVRYPKDGFKSWMSLARLQSVPGRLDPNGSNVQVIVHDLVAEEMYFIDCWREGHLEKIKHNFGLEQAGDPHLKRPRGSDASSFFGEEEVAALTGFPVKDIREDSSGHLSDHRLGGPIRCSREDIEDWLSIESQSSCPRRVRLSGFDVKVMLYMGDDGIYFLRGVKKCEGFMRWFREEYDVDRVRRVLSEQNEQHPG